MTSIKFNPPTKEESMAGIANLLDELLKVETAKLAEMRAARLWTQTEVNLNTIPGHRATRAVDASTAADKLTAEALGEVQP